MIDNKIPFHALRMLAALILATFVYYILGPKIITYPLFFFFNVLLTVQVTQRQTVGMGWKRVWGTILGSLLGLLFYYIFPHQPWVVIIYVGVAVLSSYFFFQMYVGIVGVIGIMLILDAANGLPIQYVVGRLFGAILGVLIALLSVHFIKREKMGSYQIFERASERLLDEFRDIITQLFETTLLRHDLEGAFIPHITELRELRYKLLDEDNDLTAVENEKMLKIIDEFADMYMHARVINRTGGSFSNISQELIREELRINRVDHKERMYENSVLLNIHTQKLCMIFLKLKDLLDE